ncbi:histidine phosphatase family protein [Jeotgalibacillus sp. R-1-5s-1]|uniref:histidine phosphatase family protein n=1 Tax=Jeotgalibacillus sp. R-1-5s-1 TaxID=2555897 RepID=UPI00106AB6D7|nr:histidine phosphatase family protein [Jeotgalibacillus sp. R-1-5s-1]TFD93607.1 histidine phosphatase family protein [Jeotgalibacillus sp. R-1-5s-1]
MIYVIRHGQTDLNLQRKMQGRTGLPLNENGISQAHSLKTELQNVKFDFVYSSPQERAVQTAEIVTGKQALTDERLNVIDVGEADQLPVKDIHMKGPLPDPDVYKGVEDPELFAKRIFSFMHEIEKKHGNDNVNILLSGHRCTTGCIGAYFEGIPEDRNVLKFSSDTGKYQVYEFSTTHGQ